ncbi:MAG: T9SS type A sorting domain-containing protein [Bacteroidales bacterium]
MNKKAILPIVIFFYSVSIMNAQNKDTLWFEDFERAWYDNWYVDVGTWEVGTPTSGPQAAFTGNNCAATILNGNYSDNVDTRLIRFTSFVVPPASYNPQIRFWHWFSFSASDWGEIQIKTVNGNWKTISVRYDSSGGNVWSRSSISLSDYADSTVQIAFYFHSRPLISSPDVSSGWYIDDIAFTTGPDFFKNPDDLESGVGDWSIEKGTWEIGIPASGPGNAHSGQNCFATNLHGNYVEYVNSRLISPSFIVPANSEYPRIHFWHWWSFSSEDWGEVQIKTRTGSWKPVTIRYDNYSGPSWYRGDIDLSEYADSIIQIAFFIHSQPRISSPDVSAGWYLDDITLVTGTYIFNNPEDFELGQNDWIVDKGIWEVGAPTSGPNNVQGGENCVATNLHGNYHEYIDSRFISLPFKVPAGSEGPALRFWHWFSFSSEDYGQVQISTDHMKTWIPISPQPFTSSSGSWSPFYIPLTSYADSVVQIAFYFHSRPRISSPDVSSGWYIDDIKIHDNSDLNLYAGPDLSLNPCESAILNASLDGGTGPYIFTWIPEKGLDDPKSLTPVSSPSDTTVYTLKVTDANGCFRTDRVVVNAHCEADNTETDILTYSLGKPPQSGTASINRDNHLVDLEVVYGTDLTELAATFTLSEGATATVNGVTQQSGYTTNDFTNPVTYTITAEDGVTMQDWLVTVSIAEVKPPEILSYGFGTPPQMNAAIINPGRHTVDLKVEHGTDVTGLVASFVLSDGATSTVSGIVQESGKTANDFSVPVTYSITAIDGETIQDWVVTVDVASLVDTDILTFSFGQPPQTGEAVINPVTHTVDILVAHGTDLSDLVASFTLSDGAIARIGGVDQLSGINTNDYTNPVTYTVTASDGETVQNWIITVNEDFAIGFEEDLIHGMKIYPNPITDQAVIEVINLDHSNLSLCIYGALGNKIFEKAILRSEIISLSKENLNEGVYVVVLRGEKVHVNMKVIVL